MGWEDAKREKKVQEENGGGGEKVKERWKAARGA